MLATAKEAIKDGPPLSPKLREQIVSATHKIVPSTYTLKEGAQNGRAAGGHVFLLCVAALMRALCAL
jgi:hypothetical protein